jgi:hypothetical protein
VALLWKGGGDAIGRDRCEPWGMRNAG